MTLKIVKLFCFYILKKDLVKEEKWKIHFKQIQNHIAYSQAVYKNIVSNIFL